VTVENAASPLASAPPATAPGTFTAAIWRALPQGLPAFALFCALISVWIVQNPTYGLVHDSQLYVFQALARIHPELFSQDIYLRYGSQDSYTVFSPLFAVFVRWLGPETAAAVFTVVSHAGLVAATAVLVRTLMVPARFAWLGLALVCVLPGFYDAEHKFSIIEDFASPRIFAEILVIFGITAYLKRRFRLAGSLAAAALVIHPLMTAGGVVVALCTNVTPPRVRAWILGAGAILAAAVLGVMSLLGKQLIFDEAWHEMIWTGLSYLWVQRWTVTSWASILSILLTLGAAVLALEKTSTRTLCKASLIAGASGIAVTYIAGDLLRVVLAVQVQPWRWLWIATLVVELLLPFIAYRLWSRGCLGRCATLLLVATWLWNTEAYAIGTAVLMLVAALAATRSQTTLPARTERLLLLGSAAVLVLAVIYQTATAQLYGRTIPDWSLVPWVIRDIRAFSRSGALPFIVFAVICFAVYRFDSWKPRIAIAALCATMLALLLPHSVNEWSTRWYDRDYEAFGAWRAIIPPRTEVLWFESPLDVWMQLERPSYLSGQQEASALFSHAAAVAMKKRVNSIASYLEAQAGAAWLDPPKNPDDAATDDADEKGGKSIPLEPLCAGAPDLRFIVTRRDMAAEPVATLPDTVSLRYRKFRLYSCNSSHG
jgi:hypothetical protein